MLFIQKKCNVRQRLFVTYLYVYVYNTISDYIDSMRFTILSLKMRVRHQANLNPFFNLYFTVKSYYK